MSGGHEDRMARGSMIPTLGVQLQIGVFPQEPNEPVYVTAHQSITPTRNLRFFEVSQDDWDEAEGLVRAAMVKFNAQNGGKGKEWFSPDGAQLSPAKPS